MFIGIAGTITVAGPSPDGNSLLFKADNAGNWKKLAGYPVAWDRHGPALLRLEGIDLLEINFGGLHQPLKYGKEALDFLLSRLGIRGNLFGPSHAREGVAGFIAARKAAKGGRPVAFVFRGEGLPDGQEFLMDPVLLKKSVNYQLLDAGLAFPAYYEDLLPGLREELTRACRAARDQERGFWPLDRTNQGVMIDGRQDLTKRYVILPKLFRRLGRYLQGNADLRGFQEYLAARADPVLHLPTGRATSLAALVEVEGDSVRLTAAPEDLVFAEK